MGQFDAIFLGFLLSSGFGGCFLFGCSAGLALFSTTAHRACYSPCGRAFACVARDGTNGCAASRAARGTSGAAATRSISIICCGFLLGLFLFGSFSGWRRRFRIYSGLLPRSSVAVGLVF